MLERNKTLVYLAKRNRSASKTVEVYDLPIPIRISIDPVKSERLIEKVGQLDANILVAVVQQKISIGSGDKLFIKISPPTIHDPSCNEADYMVTSIMPYHSFNQVTLKGLL